MDKNIGLKTENLGTIDEEFSSKKFSSQIGNIWFGKNYCNIANHALTKTIFRYYIGTVIGLLLFAISLVGLELLCVAMLGKLINYFDDGLDDLNYLIKISSLLISGKVLSVFLYRQYSIIESNLAMESVIKLICFIFDKILKLSPSSKQEKSSQGEIINFIQVDAPKLGNMLRYSPMILIYPIQIVVYIVILFYYLGFSFLFGIIPLFFLMLFNFFMYKKYRVLQRDLLSKKDFRMKVTTETFDSLKLLKMYAWEEEFRKRIIEARNDELNIQNRILNFSIIGITLYWTTPVLVTITTIGVYQYMNDVLDIEKILIGLYVFGLLQDPLRDLPYCITSIIDTTVSMKRIEKFLKEQEINEEFLIFDKDNRETAIKIENLSFTWGKVYEEKKENDEETSGFDESSNSKDGKKMKKKKISCIESSNKKLNKTGINSVITLNTIVNEDIDNKILRNTDGIYKNEEVKIKDKISDSEKNQNEKNFINSENLIEENKNNIYETKFNEFSENNLDERKETNDYSIIQNSKECMIKPNENLITINNEINEEKNIKMNIVLKNINIDIKKGDFIGIIGEVGSGKSSLIQAIMNNLIILQESDIVQDSQNLISNSKCNLKDNPKKIIVNGNIAFTSQIPWIQNETLKNNILFFKEYDKYNYTKVIEVCQLINDLEILPGKDMTEIGEKGINLSGGQKARVSLARAVYADKEIYLFDDPISALDADVGKKVFNNCFLEYLKNKTRVLATHNVHYLNFFDKIIWLDKGQIIFQGKMKDLENQEFFQNFTKNFNLIKNKNKENEENEDSSYKENFTNKDFTNNNNSYINNENKNDFDLYRDIEEKDKNEFENLNEKDLKAKESQFIVDEIIEEMENQRKDKLREENSLESLENIKNNLNSKENKFNYSSNQSDNSNNKINNITNVIHRITKDEDQEIGEVHFSVFLKYFEYLGGKFLVLIVFFIMLTWQALKAYSDIFLADWTKLRNQKQSEKWVYFGIFSGFAFGSCIFIYFRLFFLVRGSIRLAKNLHKDMVNNLVNAPINNFHDCTPKGQIFNRLSKDLENLDYAMYSVGSLFVCFFSCIGALVICGIYEIYTLTFIPVLFIFGFILYRYYVKTSRDLQRLEGISRSPLLNIISEVIPGAISLRIFKLENSYKLKFYEKVDNNIKINLFINGCSCWFGLYADLLALGFLIGLIVFIILFRNKFNPQSIGLLITYSLRLQSEIFLLFIRLATLENNMVSMERCLKFLDIPQEKQAKMDIDDYMIDPANDNVQTYDKKGKINTSNEDIKINFNNNFLENEYLKEDKNNNNDDEKPINEINANQIAKGNKKMWPSKGIIEFKNYSVKYRKDTPIVLENLNFMINSGEKIGIVGRTGSGKSTICNSLFRIIEPYQGSIFIDGVDITSLGLNKLRKNLTIIPQDPFILKGTLKYNVDPLNIFKDEQLEDVLKMVGFNLTADVKGIYKEIGDQGDNLSVGEKQLICIARAILRV